MPAQFSQIDCHHRAASDCVDRLGNEQFAFAGKVVDGFCDRGPLLGQSLRRHTGVQQMSNRKIANERTISIRDRANVLQDIL